MSKLKVYRIAGDGALLDQFELELQNAGIPMQSRDLMGVLGFPVPALLVGVVPFFEGGIDDLKNYPAGLASLVENSKPAFIAVLVLSSILAGLAWRRSRAFGFSPRERITWVLFVLLFGLPAYVGFLLYRRWPTRQPCPGCQALVPRDRMACAECGTRFPDPGLKGIEIYA